MGDLLGCRLSILFSKSRRLLTEQVFDLIGLVLITSKPQVQQYPLIIRIYLSIYPSHFCQRSGVSQLTTSKISHKISSVCQLEDRGQTKEFHVYTPPKLVPNGSPTQTACAAPHQTSNSHTDSSSCFVCEQQNQHQSSATGSRYYYFCHHSISSKVTQ